MILVIDSSALALLINPAASPPTDPTTGQPLHRARERVEHFTQSLAADDTLIIGTPVLAEVLVRAEDGAPGVLEAIHGLARVRVRPFGERAAVETAIMTREAIAAGDKKLGSAAPYQKVKFDRQIVAIARAEGATRLYADDHDLVGFAKRLGMDVFSTWDLPLPPPEPLDLFSHLPQGQSGPGAPTSDAPTRPALREALDRGEVGGTVPAYKTLSWPGTALTSSGYKPKDPTT